MDSGAPNENLEYTPTWVVAGVCAVIVVISLSVERILHYLGKFLKHKQQDALFQALQKLKEELMLLGFISLLLTVFQSMISQVCVPESITNAMLPCKEAGSTRSEVIHDGKDFSYGRPWNRRRLLSGGEGSSKCTSQGKAPLLSIEALHQLHIFIFVLAVVHVVFCATTMVLGGAKIRQWKRWEQAIQKEMHEKSSPGEHPTHPRRHPHYEFVKERAMGFWGKSAVVRLMSAFFKQFHASVTKSDYRALRAGFITRHCRSNPQFDFHKYMMRALEDDFRKIVGISWYLWLFVIIFLLLNVQGWHAYFWLAFLPLILLLAVGTKLEHIITCLAQEIVREEGAEKPTGGEGVPVKPSDQHFWFHRPNIVLYLIHFILFQNAFEIAFVFWIWSTYGFNSCIIENLGYLIPRLVIGVIIQVLCSYSTLPLYAIVTQMGDSFKQAVFNQQMQATFRDWAEDVRLKRKRRQSGFPSVLRMFGKKNKKQRASGSELQMQRLACEASGSSRNEMEGTIALAIEESQTQTL